MAELVLTNVEDGVYSLLEQCASRHGRTAADEAKAILAEALRANGLEAWAPVDAIYHRLATSGGEFSDSGELLREDRDR